MKHKVLIISLLFFFANLTGQVTLGFSHGVFKSGYYDLTDKTYGLGLQYQRSGFAIRFEYTRATADWRDYYHFLSLNRNFVNEFFMPDLFVGTDLAIPFSQFKGKEELEKFSRLGSRNVVPPQLNSTIHLPSLDFIYFFNSKKKLNIGLITSIKYIDNQISDESTAFRTKLEIQIDGKSKVFDSFLIMQGFERQQEFGYGGGLSLRYAIHELITLSLEGSVCNFKETSTFSMATLKANCKL
jgi:hypothetical protein